MSRSSWKPLYLDMLINSSKNNENNIFLYNRASIITNSMLGWQVYIYNGIKFYSIIITSDMIGHHVGEFSPTRKKPIIKKKNYKKKINGTKNTSSWIKSRYT